MFKRTQIILSVTVLLLIAIQPLQVVHGILLPHAESIAWTSPDNSGDNGQPIKAQGNSFIRAIKAPFKAIGRLFGRGKNNNNKLQRISEKDIKKFETVAANNVNDSRSTIQTSPTGSALQLRGTAVEHLERGRTFLDDRKLNEAISELSLAASMDPKLAEAYNLLGVACQLKGLPDQAQRAFETALKVDARNLQTLNNLGYLLLMNGDYKGAHKFLKKAVRLDPDNPRILNNLALAQFELGKFDEASKNFVRAGGEIKGRLNAADRLLIAGRTEEAHRQFDEARSRAEAEQLAHPSHHAITVLVEVKDGRVTYASVSNHKPGLEDYEASALRLARQRRFPTDRNGRESVVVTVSPQPAS